MHHTMTTSVRELKDHLSKYLRRVQRGEEVVITSHRRPIAKLVPLSGDETDDYQSFFDGLQDLHAQLNGEVKGTPLSQSVIEMREADRD